MANDSDWVADVRRWVLAGQRDRAAPAGAAEAADDLEIGYEAAHPALQSRHWLDAPGSGFGDLA